jgi:hypothetical protein
MAKGPKLGQTQRGAIAALLCLAIVLGIFDGLSLGGPSSNNQTTNHTDNYRTPELPNEPNKLTDWLLVVLNLGLVISTVLLWRANNISAKIAERALTDLEAPSIFIDFLDHGFTVAPTGVEFKTRREIQYAFVNYGRSPAMLRNVADELRAIKKGGGFPPVIDLSKATPGEMAYGVVIPPNGGQTVPFTINTFKFLLSDDGSAIYDRDKVVFLTIAAVYTDIFDNRYRLGFNFVYDKVSMKFVLSGAGNTHNYCCKES